MRMNGGRKTGALVRRFNTLSFSNIILATNSLNYGKI
jgi:hypothetical protein